MGSLIEVRVRDCACPDAPHPDGDIVYLREKISLEGGLAAHRDIVTANGDEFELVALWRSTFVRHNAVGWNLLDEQGAAVPFDVAVLVDDFEFAYPVSEQAVEQYKDAVLAPLGVRPSQTSKAGPTVVSMSARKRSTRKPPASSSPDASAGLPSQDQTA
jgi:hypothetical protein